MEITLVVAAAGTARGEVAGGAAAACRSEVAGGACWHALCQAKETTLVVAAAAGYSYLTGGRGGGRLQLSYGRARRRQAAGILAAVKTFDANG